MLEMLYIDKKLQLHEQKMTLVLSALFHQSCLLPGVGLQRMMGCIAQSKPLVLHIFSQSIMRCTESTKYSIDQWRLANRGRCVFKYVCFVCVTWKQAVL